MIRSVRKAWKSGENSKILAADVAQRTVAAMRDARLVVIPRATHNVHSDNPADFAAALDAFLSEVLPRSDTHAPVWQRAAGVVTDAASFVDRLARRGEIELRIRRLQSRLNHEYEALSRALHPLLQDGRLELPVTCGR